MTPSPATQALHDHIARHLDSDPSVPAKEEIQRLLAAGATLSFPSVSHARPGYPLALAIAARQPEWVRYLFGLGASSMLDAPPFESNNPASPAPSFQPLGVCLDILCVQTESCQGEWVQDLDNPDIQILKMVLAHGPDVLEPDPWKKNFFEPACETPLLRWADHLVALKEEAEHGELAPDQARICAAILEALFARAPGHFREHVIEGMEREASFPGQDEDASRFCRKVQDCPEVSRAWWAGVISARMEQDLPGVDEAPSRVLRGARL